MTKHTKSDPAHYKFPRNLQAIDLIDIFTSQARTNAEAYRLGNVVKYLSRYRRKDGLDDLYKAKVYLEWVIEILESESEEKSEKVVKDDLELRGQSWLGIPINKNGG